MTAAITPEMSAGPSPKRSRIVFAIRTNVLTRAENAALAGSGSFHISQNSRPTPELFQRPSPPAQPFEYLAQLANFLAVPGPVPGPLRCERRLIAAPRFRHQRLELRIA